MRFIAVLLAMLVMGVVSEVFFSEKFNDGGTCLFLPNTKMVLRTGLC